MKAASNVAIYDMIYGLNIYHAFCDYLLYNQFSQKFV